MTWSLRYSLIELKYWNWIVELNYWFARIQAAIYLLELNQQIGLLIDLLSIDCAELIY